MQLTIVSMPKSFILFLWAAYKSFVQGTRSWPGAECQKRSNELRKLRCGGMTLVDMNLSLYNLCCEFRANLDTTAAIPCERPAKQASFIRSHSSNTAASPVAACTSRHEHWVRPCDLEAFSPRWHEHEWSPYVFVHSCERDELLVRVSLR